MNTDRERLRPYWNLVDATVLDQTKRIETHRTELAERTRADPEAALTALADIAALAVNVAADAIVEARRTDRSLARREVLRTLGRRINA